jgi:hypothetical protein
MALSEPLTVAAALENDLNQFSAATTHTDAHDKFVFRRLLSECDRLQKIDVVKGSTNKAYLYSTVGDFVETERWLKNAELNGGIDGARAERLTHLVNHGYGSLALALVDAVFKARGGETLMDIASKIATAGAFNKIVKAVGSATDNNEVLVMTKLHSIALAAVDVMQQLSVTDDDVAAMIDVAGEHLRTNRLLWQGSQPDYTVLDSAHGGPSLVIAYRVDVSPKQASQMGWSLTEALIDRALDRPGVHIDFLGTALPAKLAA